MGSFCRDVYKFKFKYSLTWFLLHHYDLLQLLQLFLLLLFKHNVDFDLTSIPRGVECINTQYIFYISFFFFTAKTDKVYLKLPSDIKLAYKLPFNIQSFFLSLFIFILEILLDTKGATCYMGKLLRFES